MTRLSSLVHGVREQLERRIISSHLYGWINVIAVEQGTPLERNHSFPRYRHLVRGKYLARRSRIR